MTERQPTQTFPAADNTPAASAATHASAPLAPPPDDDPLPRPFGRYELRRLLGWGGMGRVYLAHDPHLDRLVALKMPTLVQLAGWRERFFAEARAAATLAHPHVCPVYDVGEADGQPYLTMAYIEGETLAARLRRDGPLAPAAAVELVRTVARAMHEAHRRGIVHRDLKPGNLMIDPAGRPVVMDFGLAVRTTPADDLRLTLTGVALGTPAYMPPEQAGGEHDAIGPPADVYALGVILYELVTGRVPFRAKSFGKLVAQIERDAPPPPSSLNPDVDPALETVILKALAKAPADRFAAAGDLADALDRHQQGDRYGLVSAHGRPYRVPDATGEYAPSPSRTTTAVHPRSRRRWLWAGVAALLVAAAGVVVYVETDYGQIEVQLSDPNAKVDVKVNGQEVTLAAEGGKPVRVRAGKGQNLVVSGDGFETVARTFDLKRGEVHVARVELKVVGRKDDGGGGGKVQDTPFPDKPTLVQIPGWQILTDATKGELEKWLDARRKAGHSVVWLDAVQVGDKPAFAAVAALDGRHPGWIALPEEEPNDFFTAAKKHLDPATHHVASISGYALGADVRVCALWHPGARIYQVATAGTPETVNTGVVGLVKKGYVPRALRVYPCGGGVVRGAAYLETVIGGTAPWSLDLDDEGLTRFLDEQRKAGTRPGVSACPVDGRLRWAATTARNGEQSDWEVSRNLSNGELKSKAAEMAVKGYTPASVTAHPWDGAVRYCVVWVKEPPKATPYPPKPTLIEVPGWQIYADATKGDMEKWLAERKAAKHSVTWLDAIQVGDQPVFSAVAALDDRQADWLAFLDVPLRAGQDPFVAHEKYLTTRQYRVASLSGYRKGNMEDISAVTLWRKEGVIGRAMTFTSGPTMLDDEVRNRAKHKIPDDAQWRIVRPYLLGTQGVAYTSLIERHPGSEWAYAHKLSETELAAFLEKHRPKVLRPVAVAAAPDGERAAFAVTMVDNPAKAEWEVHPNLTTDALKEKAAEMISRGFTPTCLTAYPWDGAVRYCGVWGKDPPKEKEPAKKP